jgi:ATP-dependent 26S proteasome regulatory subunit
LQFFEPIGSAVAMIFSHFSLLQAVELPLTHHDLYKHIGIDPPRGVLLYGPPGTGKTMLAKAVAHGTTAAFIRVVGSEFVQKYLGEGPRMVRDVFRLARENAPAIIFIDEVCTSSPVLQLPFPQRRPSL